MPHFFLIEGALGAGKTTIASALAHNWRIRSGNQIKILSNYELYGSTPFEKKERWIEVAQNRGSIIVWDESQQQFDRQQWSKSTTFTQIFNFSRKMRAVHIFTNPIGDNLNKRILQLVEIFMHVHGNMHGHIILDVYEYQDKRYGEWGRFIKRAYIPRNLVKRIHNLNLFDTDAMVLQTPMPIAEREQMELLQNIVAAQREAVQKERDGETTGVEREGWYLGRQAQDDIQALTDDLTGDYALEYEDSGEDSLFLSEHSIGSVTSDV